MGAALLIPAFTAACAETEVPNPKTAVAEYAKAVKAADAKQLHRLLNRESRRELTEAEVARLLRQSHAELAERARRFSEPGARISLKAVVRFKDGELTTLSIDDGKFRIDSASALPAGASSPRQALAELRSVLSRRNYAALLRLLTKDSRQAIDAQLQSLTEALAHPEGLDIVREGDRATVTTPDGHRVELEQEDGVWRVRDFE